MKEVRPLFAEILYPPLLVFNKCWIGQIRLGLEMAKYGVFITITSENKNEHYLAYWSYLQSLISITCGLYNPIVSQFSCIPSIFFKARA